MTNEKTQITAKDMRDYKLVKNRVLQSWQKKLGIELVADWLITAKMKRG
jgi:hypothetical protein